MHNAGLKKMSFALFVASISFSKVASGSTCEDSFEESSASARSDFSDVFEGQHPRIVMDYSSKPSAQAELKRAYDTLKKLEGRLVEVVFSKNANVKYSVELYALKKGLLPKVVEIDLEKRREEWEPLKIQSNQMLKFYIEWTDTKGIKHSHVSHMHEFKQQDVLQTRALDYKVFNSALFREIQALRIEPAAISDLNIILLFRNYGMNPIESYQLAIAQSMRKYFNMNRWEEIQTELRVVTIPDNGELRYLVPVPLRSNESAATKQSGLFEDYPELEHRQLNNKMMMSPVITERISTWLQSIEGNAKLFMLGARDSTMTDIVTSSRFPASTQIDASATSILTIPSSESARFVKLHSGKMLEHLTKHEMDQYAGTFDIVVEKWGDVAKTRRINLTLSRIHKMLKVGGKFFLHIGAPLEDMSIPHVLAQSKRKLTTLYSDKVSAPDNSTVSLVSFLMKRLKGFDVVMPLMPGSPQMYYQESYLEFTKNEHPFGNSDLEFQEYFEATGRPFARRFESKDYE